MRYFLIPARGGSKAILDKNLVDLGGYPLVQWTIEAAKEASRATGGKVYVTSEDSKILDVAEACGATPHKRPEYLADDHASMLDVVREFFKQHDDCNEVVLLFPTCPFRTGATVNNAIATYEAGTLKGPHTSLMSVHEHRGRPFGGVQIANGKFLFGSESEAYYRKQDTPTLYFANGAIFIINRAVVDDLNTQLFNKDTTPYVMYGMENLDIDQPFDLEVARAWVAAGRAKLSKTPAFAVGLQEPA